MKKLLALMLASLLMFTLFAACGEANGGENETTSATQPAADTTSEPAPEEPAATAIKAYIEDIDLENRTFMADDFIMITSGDTALREQYQLTDDDIRAKGGDPEYSFMNDYETVNLDETLKQYRLAADCKFEVLAMAMNPEAEDIFQSTAVTFEEFKEYNSFPCDITLAADGTVTSISQYFVP